MNHCSKSLFQINLARYSQQLRLVNASRSHILSSTIQNMYRDQTIHAKCFSLQIDSKRNLLTSLKNNQCATQNLANSRYVSKGSRKTQDSNSSDKRKTSRNSEPVLSSKDRFLMNAKKSDEPIDLNKLFKPVKIMPVTAADESNAGEELTGKLDKSLNFKFKENNSI